VDRAVIDTRGYTCPIPLAMVLGGMLVVSADTICRTLTDGRLPLGAITGMIGGVAIIILGRGKGSLGGTP